MVQQLKRDREEEMIHRGTEYARAIKKYLQEVGPYPATLEQLDNTNNIRFLRKRYKDPLTKDGKWTLLNYTDIQSVLMNNTGGAGVSAASLGSQGGQNPGQPASGFGSSTLGTIAANGQQQAVNANGIFSNGQPQSGSAGVNVMSTGQATSGDASQGGSGQGTNAFSNTFSLGSNSNGSTSQSGAGSNSGSPNATSPNPASPFTGAVGSNSPFGNSANQAFGGAAIVGVASVDKEPTIRLFNKKKTYNEWMFIYDPTQDRNNVLLRGPYQPMTVGGAQGQGMNGGTPANQLNGQQSPFGQQNNSGVVQPGGGGYNQPQQPQQPPQ